MSSGITSSSASASSTAGTTEAPACLNDSRYGAVQRNSAPWQRCLSRMARRGNPMPRTPPMMAAIRSRRFPPRSQVFTLRVSEYLTKTNQDVEVNRHDKSIGENQVEGTGILPRRSPWRTQEGCKAVGHHTLERIPSDADSRGGTLHREGAMPELTEESGSFTPKAIKAASRVSPRRYVGARADYLRLSPKGSGTPGDELPATMRPAI